MRTKHSITPPPGTGSVPSPASSSLFDARDRLAKAFTDALDGREGCGCFRIQQPVLVSVERDSACDDPLDRPSERGWATFRVTVLCDIPLPD